MLSEIHTYYQSLHTALPVLNYDRTEHKASDFAHRAATFALRHINQGPGGGAWRPGESVLLIGDRPNTKSHEDGIHQVPFVAFNGVGCSEWLTNQLDLFGISEELLYWVNAYDHNGIPTHGDFLNDLDPTKIITLGARAQAWFNDIGRGGVEPVNVPHPQYHKRFYSKHPYPLIEELKKC